MRYNETGVKAISKLEAAIKSAPMDPAMCHKLLSVLGCVEYQIEEGPCPAAVLDALREAISCWLKQLPDSARRDLESKVNTCFEKLADTMK